MDTTYQILFFFDICGTLTFTISGALVAIKHKMDIVGAIALATITGVGGGTIRDLILGANVFWTQSNWYIYLSIIIGVSMFFLYPFFLKGRKSQLYTTTLDIIDTFGLVAFTVAGVSKALLFGQTWIVAIAMGTITCVGGGMIRDMLAKQIPMVLSSRIYALPTIIGGLFYLIFYNYSLILSIIFCSIAVFITRMLDVIFNLRAPTAKI